MRKCLRPLWSEGSSLTELSLVQISFITGNFSYNGTVGNRKTSRLDLS